MDECKYVATGWISPLYLCTNDRFGDFVAAQEGREGRATFHDRASWLRGACRGEGLRSITWKSKGLAREKYDMVLNDFRAWDAERCGKGE